MDMIDILLAKAMAVGASKAYTDATIAPLLGGVHYRGSVNYFNDLPSNPQEGDAYTVKYAGTSGTTSDGTEYVWALDNDDNTYKWIGFSPDTYTKSEIDSLLSGKQATIDSSNKLSSELVDDSSSTNKFATAAQLQQIETNKINISKDEAALVELVDSGAKNEFDIANLSSATIYHATQSLTGTTIHVAARGNFGRVAIPTLFRKGNLKFSCTVSNFTKAGGAINIRFAKNADSTGALMGAVIISGNGDVEADIPVANDTNGYIVLYINTGSTLYLNSADFSNLMLCTKAAWDISQTYQPHAMSNVELTQTIGDINTVLEEVL